MPGGDGTGPAYAGGNWKCRGMKGGIMSRCCTGRELNKEEEKKMLDARLEMIKAQEECIRKRLGEIGF